MMFRSETMLLVLTLALLGTPTLGRQEYYGSTIGTYFCTAPHSGEDISAIRMTKSGSRLTSVQVLYGDTWSDVYGVKRGITQEFVLNPGEYITWIYGSHLTDIRQVVTYTDWGRQFIFGQRAGTEFTVFPYHYGQVLKGFCGFFNGAGIRGIRFEFGQPYNSSSTCK